MNKTLFLVFIISSISLSQNYGSWALTDSLIFPGEQAASVQLANGNILVTGGEDSVGIKDAEIYNYTTEKWEQTNPMIVGRAFHLLVKLNNEHILAIGGYGTKSCELYNTTNKTWSLADSLNYERSFGETATLLDNGNILITGGLYQGVPKYQYLNTCEIYDVTNAHWIKIDSLKNARESHTATKLLDGRVLIVGGFNGTNKELSVCEIYDPKIGKWSEAASLNVARYTHSATLLSDGKVLITGGENYADPQNPWLNSCELYDPAQNTWTIVNSLMVPHTDHSPVLLKNGLLLIAGGAMNNEIWELYDPHNFSNVHLDYYPDKQGIPLLNLLPNGKVLFAGGFSWSLIDGMLYRLKAKMCYLYDPDGINSIEEETNNTLKDFKLYRNYPNPFNPNTTIKYYLPRTSHVIIKIYNSLGIEITTLVNKTQASGNHMVNFSAQGLSSGMYIYQIVADKWTKTDKMLVIK